MRTLVAFPSTATFAQQAALAFHERGALVAYLTAFAYQQDGRIDRLLKPLPQTIRTRLEAQLKRRTITELPPELVEQQAFWEIVRVLADKAGASAPVIDRIWDRLSHEFTRHAGRRLVSGVDAVYAYEYTAREAFEAAAQRGIVRILDFPSLNSRQFETLQLREKALHPELRSRHDKYFTSLFERRQARRDAEMALADVIITNSSVTRASHIAGGADPNKTFAVPYGAPPAIETARHRPIKGPLRVIWAGTFGLRKGAHHFVQAWRTIARSNSVTADIYGALSLPERLWRPEPPGMTFHGSVVRPVLFDAYDAADILVFPTLSDGFGMVVTEAFSRGLPVITTDQAGACDLVEHKKNGLIIPAGDPASIVRALEWCLNNRERVSAMRAAALQSAKNWQWSDYRCALIEAVATRLTAAGRSPSFEKPFRPVSVAG